MAGRPATSSKTALLCLALLTTQSSILTLFMRYAVQKSNASPTSMVVVVEVCKLLLSITMEHFFEGGDVLFKLKQDWLLNSAQIMRLSIPAALYAMQNNLSYYSLNRVNAVTFQVMQQMKIMTTALFAVFILGKSLRNGHWTALALLTMGLILVQSANSSQIESKDNSLEVWKGFMALLISSISSGYAGVYFERLIKSNGHTKSRSLWIQNIQLGLFGLLFSLILYYLDPNNNNMVDGGLITGYDVKTWVTIGMQACGGVLVAMVVRYSDSIMKSFATAASIILSGLITVIFLGESLSFCFCIGTSAVISSVFIFSTSDQNKM